MRYLDPRAVIVFFIRDKIGPLLLVGILACLLLASLLGSSDLTLFNFGVYGTGPSAASTSEATALVQSLLILLATIVLPIFFLLSLIWAWLQFSNYRYELTETDFRKEYGIIHKRYVSIPYEQVQNVDVIRTLLDRLLGLSELQIQTAGISDGGLDPSAEGVLPGLSRGDADSLRNDIIRRASLSQ